MILQAVITVGKLSKLRNKKHKNYVPGGHEGKDDWQFEIIDLCNTNA